MAKRKQILKRYSLCETAWILLRVLELLNDYVLRGQCVHALTAGEIQIMPMPYLRDGAQSSEVSVKIVPEKGAIARLRAGIIAQLWRRLHFLLSQDIAGLLRGIRIRDIPAKMKNWRVNWGIAVSGHDAGCHRFGISKECFTALANELCLPGQDADRLLTDAFLAAIAVRRSKRFTVVQAFEAELEYRLTPKMPVIFRKSGDKEE